MLSVVSFHLTGNQMHKLESVGCCPFKEAQSKLPLGSVCSDASQEALLPFEKRAHNIWEFNPIPFSAFISMLLRSGSVGLWEEEHVKQYGNHGNLHSLRASSSWILAWINTH